MLADLARQYGYLDISGEARQSAIDTYAVQSRLFPEVKDTLERLLAVGVKMIVASDNDRDILAAQRAKYDLDRYFSDYCISEDAGSYKPADGFQASLRKHLADGSANCYFVGDTSYDVECGKRLGIKSVLVARRAPDAAEADYIIQGLDRLISLLRIRQPGQS